MNEPDAITRNIDSLHSQFRNVSEGFFDQMERAERLYARLDALREQLAS